MKRSYWYCRYHDKRTWKSRQQAQTAADKANKADRRRVDEGDAPLRVHWCQIAGGYHHTSITESEFNRRQTLPKEEPHVPTHDQRRRWEQRQRKHAGRVEKSAHRAEGRRQTPR